MFQVAFVISTFVFTGKFITFAAAVIMLPIYAGQFIMIYGLRMNYVKETEIFRTFGGHF
jgi:hypothetical protein